MRCRLLNAAALNLLIVTAPCAARVRAEPFHHQPIPLGERAVALGGAFTGLANEPSASYYNPAGLVRLQDTSVSAGLTLSAFDRYNVDNGYRANQGSTPLKHAARPALPIFVSFVKQIGPRGADRLRHHAIAFSIFTLERRTLTFDAEIARAASNGQRSVDTVYVQDEHDTRWHGFSYAYRATDVWTIGASTFLSVSRMNYVEERLSLALGAVEPNGDGQDSALTAVSRRTSNNVKTMVVRFGVLYTRPRVRIGAMLQPKSAHIKGNAKVRAREAMSAGTGAASTGSYVEGEDNSLAAHEPFPWELRTGASYKPRDDLTIAGDLSLYGWNSDEVVSVGAREVDPKTSEAPPAGTFVVERWRRHATANVSLGIEYTVWDALMFRGGFFTDLSAAPGVPKSSTTYRPADVDRFGTGLSVGFVGQGYDISLGVLGRFGRGDALAYIFAGKDDAYVRTTVREQTFFVFLTGVRRTVGKLTDATVKKIREMREKDGVTP